MFAVPYLRGDADVRDWLWNGHPELVAAISHRDREALRRAVADYNGHALSWADRLAAGDPAHPGHAPRPDGPDGPAAQGRPRT